jgi:hypothetical protein
MRMRIVIDIDENGFGTYQHNDLPPAQCALRGFSQSVETKPIFEIGRPNSPLMILRDNAVNVLINLSVDSPAVLPQAEPDTAWMSHRPVWKLDD